MEIIENNIYGVDIEPMAVEIARLRAWLSLIVDEEDGREVEPLPNLDFKFVCANSLVPLDKELGLFSDSSLHQKLKDTRNKYFNARKPHTKKALQDEYYKLTKSEQTALIADDRRTVQLKSFDPFKNAYPSDFFDPEQMFGLVGFSIVIGNPPYGAKYPKALKSVFQNHYIVTQTKDGYKGSLDTYVLFIELGFNLLSKNGNLHYIVPISITSSDSVSQAHKLLESKSKLIRISSYSVRPKPIFDNAMVNTSILFFNKTDSPNEKIYSTKMYRRSSAIEISDIVSSLKFQDVTNLKLKGRYPKISDDIEVTILNKLNSIPTKIRDLQSYEGAPIYYRFAGGRYFKVITNYTTNSSAERKIMLKEKYSNLVGAVLSTSLFFWYYQVFSDNLNLKNFEVESFPVPIDMFSDNEIENINNLYEEYLQDIQSKSKVRQTAKYANIDEFREYKIGKSFKKIDKLDDSIDSYFGLNQEEVNYIKKYDRSFRNDEDE